MVSVHFVCGVRFEEKDLQFFLNLMKFTYSDFFTYDDEEEELKEAMKPVEVSEENIDEIKYSLADGIHTSAELPHFLNKKISLKFHGKRYSVVYEEVVVDSDDTNYKNPFEEMETDTCGGKDCNCLIVLFKKWICESTNDKFKMTYHVEVS